MAEPEKERDWVRGLGTALVVIGVGIWGVYAVGKYLLDWQVTDRDFLPYHLAVILPGMILRYHRFFFGALSQRFSGRKSTEATIEAESTRPVIFKVLIVINNFVHDLFTGLWVSSVLVVYLLEGKARSSSELLISPILHEVMKTFFWLGITSIAVILATGALRLLYYGAESIRGDREIKRNLLIVKHVLFSVLFMGGTYLAYLYAFK